MSFRLLAHPHHGLYGLAPRHCRVQQGQWHCWGNCGSPCRAGRWQLTPSHPLSCDKRRQFPALQTPQTLDPEHKDRGPLRSEPAERRTANQWLLSDGSFVISVSDHSMFPYRLHQTVGWATFLSELSAELWGNSEGGVRSVRRRSYNTTVTWHFVNTSDTLWQWLIYCFCSSFLPDVPAGPPYQAGLGAAPVTLTPDEWMNLVSLNSCLKSGTVHIITLFAFSFTSSSYALLPLTSSSSPRWAALLLYQNEGSIEEAATARTRVCPGCRGGQGVRGRVRSIIIVEHLLWRRTRSVTCHWIRGEEAPRCATCVCVWYLCPWAAGWWGGVVCTRDRQVVAAALPPQTLDVKWRLPTWQKTRRQTQSTDVALRDGSGMCELWPFMSGIFFYDMWKTKWWSMRLHWVHEEKPKMRWIDDIRTQ